MDQKNFNALLKKVINRETISYIIFGVLTTIVSLVTYKLFTLLFLEITGDKQINISTVLSWILAVAFAFITNKLFVFESKTKNFGDVIKELFAFVTARLLSLGYELVWMNVTVKIFHWNDFLCKVIAQFVIVALNYIFSKLFIFKKGEKK